MKTLFHTIHQIHKNMLMVFMWQRKKAGNFASVKICAKNYILKNYFIVKKDILHKKKNPPWKFGINNNIFKIVFNEVKYIFLQITLTTQLKEKT